MRSRRQGADICRHSLVQAMHRQGLRLDDAALAADVAVAHTRKIRDRLIVAARRAGLSYRQIGRIVGLSHPAVIAVVSREAGGLPPKD